MSELMAGGALSAVFDGLVCCSSFCGIGLCSAVLAKPLNNGALEIKLYAVVFEQVAGKRRRHAFNFAAAQMKERSAGTALDMEFFGVRVVEIFIDVSRILIDHEFANRSFFDQCIEITVDGGEADRNAELFHGVSDILNTEILAGALLEAGQNSCSLAGRIASGSRHLELSPSENA